MTTDASVPLTASVEAVTLLCAGWSVAVPSTIRARAGISFASDLKSAAERGLARRQLNAAHGDTAAPDLSALLIKGGHETAHLCRAVSIIYIG